MDLEKKRCHRCKEDPAQGERPLLKCSGCKTAYYCGHECQKQDWKIHKPLCIHSQQDHAITREKDNSIQALFSPLPPQQYRIDLLKRFTTLHGWSVQKGIYAALTSQGGAKNFDYTAQCLQFNLEYRKDCNGNPAIAFRIMGAKFRPLAELQSYPALEAGRLIREEAEARLRATEESFVGLVIVMWSMEDYSFFIPGGLYWNGAQFDEVIKQLQPSAWLQQLQSAVEKGYVLQQIKEDRFGWYPGQMVKEAGEWKWKKFTGTELAAMTPGSPPAGFGETTGLIF